MGGTQKQNIQSVSFPYMQIQSLFHECFSQEGLISLMKALKGKVPGYLKNKNHSHMWLLKTGETK